MSDLITFSDIKEDGSGTVVITVDDSTTAGKIQNHLINVLKKSSGFIYEVDGDRIHHNMKIKFAEGALFNKKIIDQLLSAKIKFNLKLHITPADKDLIFYTLHKMSDAELTGHNQPRRASTYIPTVEFSHQQSYSFDDNDVKAGGISRPKNSPNKRRG